jgi:hypothetical protein
LAKLSYYISERLNQVLTLVSKDETYRVPQKVIINSGEIEFLKDSISTSRQVPIQNLTQDNTITEQNIIPSNPAFEESLYRQLSMANEMETVMGMNKETRKKLLTDSVTGMDWLYKIAELEIKARFENVKHLHQNLEAHIAIAKENIQFEHEKEINLQKRMMKLSQRNKEIKKKAVQVLSKLQGLSQSNTHKGHQINMTSEIEEKNKKIQLLITSMKEVDALYLRN